MGKMKREVINGPKKQIFANWCTFDFLKSEIELIRLEQPSIYFFRWVEVLVLPVFLHIK